eukprot:1143745-Pelagomonas_calceolata.AAC.2
MARRSTDPRSLDEVLHLALITHEPHTHALVALTAICKTDTLSSVLHQKAPTDGISTQKSDYVLCNSVEVAPGGCRKLTSGHHTQVKNYIEQKTRISKL